MKFVKFAAAGGKICADDAHDFVSPYPFRCRKCGLSCKCREQEINRYLGSYFNGCTFQWNVRLNWKRITAFSLSTGKRPVYHVECDFSHLRVQNCLQSKDGWMQSELPADFLQPKEMKLCKADGLRLKKFIKSCDFSTWETPSSYVGNWITGACGFHTGKMFTCQFAGGRKFICLEPEEEFEQLVSLVREIADKIAPDAEMERP